MFCFLFVYSIAAYAISAMLVYFNGPFKIIDKFRNWLSGKHETFNELFSCMFCMPINVGVILSIVSLAFIPFPITPFTFVLNNYHNLWPIIIILDACYTGGIVYLINTVQEYFERKEDNE